MLDKYNYDNAIHQNSTSFNITSQNITCSYENEIDKRATNFWYGLGRAIKPHLSILNRGIFGFAKNTGIHLAKSVLNAGFIIKDKLIKSAYFNYPQDAYDLDPEYIDPSDYIQSPRVRNIIFNKLML